MAGYKGWSMSNNAVAAYENGEMPRSKWSKNEIIGRIEEAIDEGEIKLNCSIDELQKVPREVLRDICLRYSSWHHTGKYYKTTDFYNLDIDYIEKLTDEALREAASQYRKDRKREKEEKAAEISETWECGFLEWYGTRNHPKAREIVEIGTIKGKWFYRSDGHKKDIYATGFRKIRQIA